MQNVIIFPSMTVKMDRPPNRIREWRAERRLTQKELGALTGHTGVLISHWEVGRRDPGLAQLQSLARALQVDTVDLLNRDDNPQAMDQQAKDFMRVWPHIDEDGREQLRGVAEKFAGFKAQPPILPFPTSEEVGNAAPAKKGRNAA